MLCLCSLTIQSKQIPVVAASSYGIEKVFGADNAQAAQAAFLNGIFALAGGRTNAAKELNGKTILTELPQSFRANLQVKASELKAAVQAKVENAGQYRRDKVTVTDAEVAQARKVIANYQAQQAKAPTLNASLYMPPVPTDPKVLKAYETLAKKVLSDGATNFTQFSQRLIGTGSKKGQEVIASRMDELFTKNASETVVAANKAELEAFKEYKATYQAIADFRSTNRIPEFSYPKNVKGEPTGTVAMAKADGKSEFGTSTIVGEKYLGTNNSVIRKHAIIEIQSKLGKLQGAIYNDLNTKFLTHAEAESLNWHRTTVVNYQQKLRYLLIVQPVRIVVEPLMTLELDYLY